MVFPPSGISYTFIQKHLLPTKIPRVEGLKIEAKYRPAGLVAGDLWDVFRLPSGKTAVTILDVSGHGIGAALLTGVVKMSLNWRLGEEENPAKAISNVNNDILSCMSDSDEQFVTVIVGVWNPQDTSWTYCAAGHAGGLLQTGHQVCNLSATGPLLGVFVGAQWEDKEIKMSKGDKLFLYSGA